MDGLHWPDLLVIVGVGILVFGPKRLPELGASVGSALRELRQSLKDNAPTPIEADSEAPPVAATSTSAVPAAPPEGEIGHSEQHGWSGMKQ